MRTLAPTGSTYHKSLLNLREAWRKSANGAVDLVRRGPVQALAGIADRDAIVAVGHRVVHGGERFAASVRIDGEVREIDEVGQLTARRPHTIEVVVDRLVIRPNLRNRLADSLELAVARAEGRTGR